MKRKKKNILVSGLERKGHGMKGEIRDIILRKIIVDPMYNVKMVKGGMLVEFREKNKWIRKRVRGRNKGKGSRSGLYDNVAGWSLERVERETGQPDT